MKENEKLKAILKNDKEARYKFECILKDIAEKNVYFLEYVAPELLNNEQIMYYVVMKNGLALQYASESLRDNESIVRRAIGQNYTALQYASERLQNDIEILFKIASTGGFTYATDRIRKLLTTKK